MEATVNYELSPQHQSVTQTNKNVPAPLIVASHTRIIHGGRSAYTIFPLFPSLPLSFSPFLPPSLFLFVLPPPSLPPSPQTLHFIM